MFCRLYESGSWRENKYLGEVVMMICPLYDICKNDFCIHKKPHSHSEFGCQKDRKGICSIRDVCTRQGKCDGSRECVSLFEFEMKKAIKGEER